jgi:phage terminase large subunit-like protein
MNEFFHGAHPILRWMMGTCVIQNDSNGNIKIDKLKSGNKIDGIAATINALAQYMDFKDESNIYNKKDLIFI